ncbi:MAG TPA: hypothetical protein VG095_09160, partial [Chthoniobacterales bacterium]|nr:hypothetical protein [Chthoniobacterales bacterium]
MKRLACIAGAFLLLINSALAALTFDFHGYIDTVTVNSPFLPAPQLNSPVIGRLSFGDNFAVSGDQIPDPSVGGYRVLAPHEFGLSMSVAGNPNFTYGVLPPYLDNFVVQNTASGDSVRMGGDIGFSGILVMRLVFFDGTGRTLNSDAWTFDFGAATWESVIVEVRSILPPTDP